VSDDITGLCREHSFETADEVCRRCGGEFCELCLVYPFGANKPLCKECAMVAGGVRNHSSRPELKGRAIRTKVKAFEQRRRRVSDSVAATPAVEVTDPTLDDPRAPTDERIAVPVPGPAEQTTAGDDPPPPPPPPSSADGVAPPIDWSQPFG
jgi:hypothetical protein